MDDFSDDDFDDLNIDVLQELETKALQSLRPSQSFGRDTHDHAKPSKAAKANADVNQSDAEVLRELARVPTVHAFAGRLTAAAAPPPLPLPAYSQRDFVDVPLPATNNAHGSYYPAASQQRARLAVPRLGPPIDLAAGRGASTGRSVMPTRPVVARNDPKNSGGGGDGGGGGGGGGQAAGKKMANYSNSMADLQAQVCTLQMDLYAAQGKASMMETKYETALRTHEADLQKMQRHNDEELARQRQRADEAVAAHQSAATELEFAKQDLREAIEKNKKSRRAGRLDAPTTPRKNTSSRSNWDVADGFDDVELLPSPSRGFGRRLKDAGGGAVTPAVERTPGKAKRRRPVTDSPSKPLETLAIEDADIFSASSAVANGRVAARTADATRAAPDVVRIPETAPFLFIQEVLGRQTTPGGPTTTELFSHYSFPSNRKQTLAFLILQRIPKLEGMQGTTQLMLDFCQLLLGIWSQCMREKYFAPVRALVSLLSYVLSRDPTGLAPHILASLLPIAQQTIYSVTEPAFDGPTDSLSNHPDYNVRQLVSDVDVGAIISLLRLIALGCLTQSQDDDPSQTPRPPSQAPDAGMSVKSQKWFWSEIQFEFVLMLITSKQPPDAFMGMLALLRTSALPDSIGPITDDPACDSRVVASVLLERITHHIEEPPKWATPCRYTEWDVRLAALGVLDCFAQSPFGRLSLAASHCVLPRLIDVFFPAYGELRSRTLLDDPLDPPDGFLFLPESKVRAYGIGGFDLSQIVEPGENEVHVGSSAGGASVSTQTQTVETSANVYPQAIGSGTGGDSTPLILVYVSATIYLLHSILADPYTASVASIQTKLAKARGDLRGLYVLTLARLAFRADPAFAVGLPDETYKLAMELLTLATEPDEFENYAQWAQESQQRGPSSSQGNTAARDPFSNDTIGEDLGGDMAAIKIEDGVS